MTRFTRAAGRWFTFGVFLGTALSCGRVFAGDRLHQKGQLVAVPVTTVTAPAQAVPVPIYSVPVMQAVPMQFGYIQPMQAGAVYLSAPTQSAAVTTAQAPVINIKLEAPSTPAMTATVPRAGSQPPGRISSLPSPERGRSSAGHLRGPGFADLLRLERSCVSAGGSNAALRRLEGPHAVFSSTARSSRASEFATRDVVRSSRYPVGPRRADTRRAVGRGLFLAGHLAWLGQQSRPSRSLSVAFSCFPPDAVNDAGNELVVVGSRRDGLRLAAQAA